MSQSDLSFNEDPRPLPLPFREYKINIGDLVGLRANVGDNNALLIAEIIAKMGPGPFEVDSLGSRKHRVKNSDGQFGWISLFFLVPEGASPDD